MPERSTIRIVAASAKDAALAASLFDAYRQFYKKPPEVMAARIYLKDRLKKKESILFLAFLSTMQGKPVGLVHLYPTFSSLSLRPIWILNDLFVTPQARGRRVGEALMNRARKLAQDTGASALILETATGNLRAQRLYERLGYERDTAFYRYELAI